MGRISNILSRLVVALLLVSCDSSSFQDVVDDVREGVDLLDGVPRKSIDTTRLGTNAFANDQRFGTPAGQLTEVRDVLRLSYIRVLFAWSNEVQPFPESEPNFGFYDEILRSVPSGLDVLIVVTAIPSWFHSNAYWDDGNPRSTYVRLWVAKLLARYGHHPSVVGFQFWNEPNMERNFDNRTMGFLDSPESYVEMLALSHDAARDLAPGKMVLNAATTAINQNYPESLEYNRGMRDAGALGLVDRWAAHYYGEQFENVVRSGGVADFLTGLGKGVWITESGAQGVGSQLAYGERAWRFLIDNISSIERIYQYQFAEDSPPDVTYGLRNLNRASPVSDLYVFLRDRP